MRGTETAALLEREAELGRLDGLVDDVCAGSGRAVLIEGTPGIGKSRLLDELRGRAGERDMTVLSARASELDRDFPFGVVRQLFEPLLRAAGGERRGALLHGGAEPAGALLGLAAREPADATPAAGQPLATLHALYWLTANLSDEGPAALAIDDLHWADAGSLRFLRFLLPRLGELPVLVALATRSGEPGSGQQVIDAIATDPLTLVLRPAALSEPAVASLIAAELGETPDAVFSSACRDATGGNPFLLRELLQELAADRVSPSAAHVDVVRELAPPTVARAVLLRLARLRDEASELARAVAVLGDAVPLSRARALAGLSDELAEEAAAALGDAHILATDRPLSFAHPILRSAVYGDIPPGERDRAHRRAAALLADEGVPSDAVAVHLLASEPAGDPEVVATLRDAAGRALERGAPAVAADCLRRALAEPPPGDERRDLVVELASAELHAGDPAAAAEHFAEGSRLTSDPRVRAGWVWDHAVALMASGRADEGYALRERAVEDVAELDRDLALAIETSLIASAGLDLSRLDWVHDRLARRRGELSGASPAEWRLLAMQAYNDALYGDAPADALAGEAERAIASGELIDRASQMATTPFFAAVETLWLADRSGPAKRTLDEQVDSARRRGSSLGFASYMGWRCQLLARDGELAEAEADARSCADLALPLGGFALAPPMLGYVLDVLLARGELGDAERLLEESGAAARPADDDLSYFPMLHARARLRAARGDVAGARSDFEALGRRRARWNSELALIPALLAAPEVADEDRDALEAHTGEMLRDARSWGTPRAIGMALRAAGLAEGGASGLELLEEAAATLERSPARVEHARALADFGAALRRSGRRSDAREPLRAALDLADSCGARPVAERARQELRAAGARPRRPRMTGADALTPSERRTASMAAAGLSNPEIAQALFVTKKTVEAHLGSAYRKLGIRSRAELAGALRDARD